MRHTRLSTLSLLLATSLSAPGWAVPSTTVSVSGQVVTPTTFGLSALQALPQATRTESYTAAGSPVTTTFGCRFTLFA